MKAVQMTAAGGPEVLLYTDMEEPRLTTDTQIKVRLKAAGVNPIDTKLRRRGVFAANALPAVLGCDGAGEVVETGKLADQFKVGEAVWFCHGGLGLAQGNYAEYTVLEQSLACRKPGSLSFEQAAAGPLVLITAWEALFDRACVQSGQTVLIHGGGGGVGHVAIQLAKMAGAKVITTVSDQWKSEFVQRLGADEVICYEKQDFVTEVLALTDGRGVDVALDVHGGGVFRRTMEAMAYYGSLITLLDPGPDVDWKQARDRNLRIGFELMLTPMLQKLPRALSHHRFILDECAKRFDDTSLLVYVDSVFPLRDAAKAHELIEHGHAKGKLVLTP